MDPVNFQKSLKSLFQKYKAMLVVILAGILLMMLPDSKPEPKDVPVQKPASKTFAQELEDILSGIQGAGRVELLLSEEAGPVTVYETNEEETGGGLRKETVIVSGENRQENGLIRLIHAPRYRGAVVIAQGADSPAVKLAIVKAVSSAAGLSSDKITVLKMK